MSNPNNFFEKLRVAENGCIEFIGARRNEYGVICWDGVQRMATHVSWFLKHGVWPEKHLLHRCDNPPCVRIGHLFEGDDLDNARDRDAKGRHRVPRGEDASNARLTEAQVLDIIARGQTAERVEDIGARYGIKAGHVSNIIRGFTWKHLPRPDGPKPIARHKDAFRVDFHGEWLTPSELEARFGVGAATIKARAKLGLTGDDLIAKPHAGRRKTYTRRK